MRPLPIAIAALLLLCLPCQGDVTASPPWGEFRDIQPENIRGLTIAPIEDLRLGEVGYGTQRCAESIELAASLGATWISITPFGRMDDLESTDVLPDFEIPLEENEDRIARTITMAREAGLRVALIPHIYVMSGEWRGQIDPGDDDAWEEWFESYSAYVLRYARFAEENGVALFSIGVEFKSSTNFRPLRWRRLIASIRAEYKGLLTYSANWDEADQVPFWDALDLIGINAFWPLASKPGDGFDEMSRKALEISAQLEALSYYHDRPILFTEMGVKSATDAALAPWEWPEDCDNLRYDEQYQAAAYEALFETLATRRWFEGLFIWKYFSDPYDETQEKPTGFSPHGKQAEEVLARWFSLPWDDSLIDLLIF